jgi:hypothetical protein
VLTELTLADDLLTQVDRMAQGLSQQDA